MLGSTILNRSNFNIYIKQPLLCIICINTVPWGRLCGGADVTSGEYRDALKEFMDICMLCNDSGLDYNEVSRSGAWAVLATLYVWCVGGNCYCVVRVCVVNDDVFFGTK